MAIVVDHESEYKGERKVRDAIAEHLSDDVVIYNNREVNGREYDICLLVKDFGVFIVEVKGWLSEKINVHGIDDIEVEGYAERQKSPKKQAKSYCIQYFTKLKKQFAVSPLVVDLVAYPFITKEQYYEAHLNIISEEQFTLFKEDLEDQMSLKKKLKEAFDAKKAIPHAELNADFMSRIRRSEEPDYEDPEGAELFQVYSTLSIIPGEADDKRIKKIVAAYIKGIKQIVFVSKRPLLERILGELNSSYKKENIEPGEKLKVGYKKGIESISARDSYRAFNIEVYLIPELDNKCPEEITIEEGQVGKNAEVLSWIAEHSCFNLQQYYVEHASADKNTLVEAGAGTGKTYSMVSRVAFLCNKRRGNITSVEDELAMVTFTNDAAINMKSRLKQMFVNYYILTGNECYLQYVEGVDRSNISTIHKFSLELLRGASFYTGLGTNFKISSDEYDRGKIYDLYLSEFLRTKEEENPNFISEIPVPIYDLKKKLIGIADHLLQKSVNLGDVKPEEMGVTVDNTLPYFNDLIKQVIFPAEIDYLSSINDRNAMDLKECIILLNKVLDYGAENISNMKLRYLFVDEFQDTDDVQIEVFQKIQKAILSECRLFVVGDLKQSIYRFRGARLSAFDQLKTYRKYDWEVYHLNINYRTDSRLLDLYDSIFHQMGVEGYLPYDQKDDRLTSEKIFEVEETDLIQCIPCHGKDEEAFFNALFGILENQTSRITKIMAQKNAEDKELSLEERTIAILVRSNWQVENIVKEAEKRNVNVEIKSGGDLFQLESTQDLYKLVLAVENSSNPVYLVNFIESNYTDLKLDYQRFRGMSEIEKLQSLQKILDEFFMLRMKKRWQEVLDEIYTQPVLYALKHLYDALEPWKIYGHNTTAQTFYMANYDYLLEKIVKFSRIDTLTINQIARYLEINILTRQNELARTPDSDEEGVHILCTTVHKSKGLEYGTIVLPYTAEDISDIRKVKLDANYSKSKLSYTVQFENKVRERNSNYNEDTEKTEQIAEESRILYVALTRAIRNCVWIMDIDKSVPISWGILMEA